MAAPLCYSQSMQLLMNGNLREFPSLADECSLADVVEALGLKGDRIAIEHQGNIAPRASWAQTPVRNGDKLEVVHFVGGGAL